MRVENGMFIVDDRHRYPVAQYHAEDMEPDSMGFPFSRRRALLRFETGANLSIIWGYATYSTNYDAWLDDQPIDEDPGLVEVWASWEEEPEGYCDAPRVLELIAQANVMVGADG